jgi:CTP synthase (UTP-ammonia lyase)
MNARPSIGIVGDYRDSETHRATTFGLEHAAAKLGFSVEITWFATDAATRSNAERVRACCGLFIAPGSPYADLEAVLEVIRDARERSVPLLGTCGGFQHVVLELARNALGLRDAQHAEYAPEAAELVIAPLACSLVGQRAEVRITPGSRAAAIYKTSSSLEAYRCSFGLSAAYEAPLEAAGLSVSGRDAMGEARIVERLDHPFYMATLFIPQLTRSIDHPHPLLTAFVAAARNRALEEAPR